MSALTGKLPNYNDTFQIPKSWNHDFATIVCKCNVWRFLQNSSGNYWTGFIASEPSPVIAWPGLHHCLHQIVAMCQSAVLLEDKCVACYLFDGWNHLQRQQDIAVVLAINFNSAQSHPFWHGNRHHNGLEAIELKITVNDPTDTGTVNASFT